MNRMNTTRNILITVETVPEDEVEIKNEDCAVGGFPCLEFAMFIVGMVISCICIIVIVALYCYASHKKKKDEKALVNKYEKIRKVSGEPPLHGIVTEGTSIAGVSEKHLPLNVSLQNVEQTEAGKEMGNVNISLRDTNLPELNLNENNNTQTTDNNNDNNNKQYKSEQEMIEEVINSNAANEIKYEDLIMDKKIGNGHFGAVYKAIWEGNVVVVKQLNSDPMKEENDNNDDNYDEYTELKQAEIDTVKEKNVDRLKEMKGEIILASSLPTHYNLVEIFGYVRSPFGIVMSYMPGDSVKKYVYRIYKKDTDSIPTIIEILIILRKAASGLKFLHQYGLIHRDIAARNILLGKINNNHIQSSTEVKISDFGLTRELQHDNEQETQSNIGPLKWMSPESIKQKIYSKQSDVYMFGITMWEIFYGIEPYQYLDINAVNVAMRVVDGERPQKLSPLKYKFTKMPNQYQQLMECCWAETPKDRPDFSKIVDELLKMEANPNLH